MSEVDVQDKTDNLKQMPEKLRVFIDDLRKKVETDDDNRLTWKTKLVTAVNQRLGIKRVSNKPYPGAPNIPLPETDKLIRKQKPNYVMSSYNQKNLCSIDLDESYDQRMVTEDIQKAVERAEIGLNYVLRKKMDWLKKLAIATDNFLEKGHCIFKIIEKYSSVMINKTIDLNKYDPEIISELEQISDEELKSFIAQRYSLDIEDKEDNEVLDDIVSQFRSGEDIIKFTYEQVKAFPDIIIPPPEKIIVPSFATDIETAERVTHEYFLTRREMEERASAEIFDVSIIDKLDKLEFKPTSKTEYDILDQQMARNEGVGDAPEGEGEIYRIRETVTWYKPEGSKRYERWVFTFLPDVASVEDSLLQKIPFPYDLDTWNYVKHDHESKSWRYHDTRGVPEMIRAIQEFMERSMNNMLIRDEINNAPIYTVLTSSKIQSSNIRFIPGQKVKVAQHGEIARLDDGQSKVDLSSERINQTLKAYAEEYLGSVDQLFRNATNKGGGKTLGEIEQGMQMSNALISLDIMLWNETLKKVYTMVFYILKDRLEDPIIVDGVTVTREDFNFIPDITPTGSIDAIDRKAMSQRALMRYQVVAGEAQRGLIVTAEDLYNTVRDYLEWDGVKNPDRYISPPEEVQKIQQEKAAAEAAVIDQQDAQLAQEQQAVAARAGGADATGAGTKSPA